MDGVSAREKRRWLVRFWIGQAAALYLATPAYILLVDDGPVRLRDCLRPLIDLSYVTTMAIVAAVVTALQWAYLRPIRPPVPGRRPVRMLWSMLIGAFAIATMIAAAALAYVGFMHDYCGRPGPGEALGWALLGLFAINWILATPLLMAFADRAASHEDLLARVATRLFAGTVIEVLAVMPLDVLARERERCSCSRGTLQAVWIGTAIGVILFGPVVFFVLLARRRTRWPGGRCGACGADVGDALVVKRCPACGAGWAD